MAIVGIRLPDKEKALLAADACRNNKTISNIVRSLIREYLSGYASLRESYPAESAQGALPATTTNRKREKEL